MFAAGNGAMAAGRPAVTDVRVVDQQPSGSLRSCGGLLRNRGGDLLPFLRCQALGSLYRDFAGELRHAPGQHRLSRLLEGFEATATDRP